MPLFGRKDSPPRRKAPPHATSEGLREAAEFTAADAARTLGIRLDFTRESLKTLDDAIDRFVDPSSPLIGVMVMSYGAYLGEVVVRTLGGRWRPSSSLDDVAIVEIGRVAEVYPMRRVAKRIQEGSENSLDFWYETIAKYRSGPSSPQPPPENQPEGSPPRT